MRDKDILEITNEIAGFADQVVCTCANKTRGLSAKELKNYFPCATANEDPENAFIEAERIAKQKKGILVVCGSFYLAAHVFAMLAETRDDVLI